MDVTSKCHERKLLQNLATQLLHALAHVDTDCNSKVVYKMHFAVFYF